jgi:predicted ATPase
MIQHISIKNFKSIVDVSVDLSPTTVLIGRSGVGKSNFIRAIRFLRNYLVEPSQAVSIEGGWTKILPFGNPADLSFSVRFAIPGYEESFTYNLQLKGQNHNPLNMLVRGEQLTLGADVIFHRSESTWAKRPEGGSPDNPSDKVYLNTFPTLSEAVLAYTAWTSGIGWHDFPANVFAPAPSSTGIFAHAPSSPANLKLTGLDDTAGNYLEVIRDMTQDLRNQHARRQILARLKQVNPTVDSVELDSIIQPQRVVVAHKIGGQRVGLDLSQESDGFRRYYAHLLALYQTPPKQVLMFEEPENGIYPGALRNLADEFNSAPAASRGQVLLTTQSPELLDGFVAEQLRVVELDEHQTTKIAALDPDQAEAVRDRLLEPGELLTVDTARARATA